MRRAPAVLAAASGAACLAILIGMLVSHAWPLWTGEAILLRVRGVDSRDPSRGNYVRLTYDLNRLEVIEDEPEGPDPESDEETDDALAVRPIGDWWQKVVQTPHEEQRSMTRRLRDRVFYIQLEPGEPAAPGDSPVHGAVSISDSLQPGRVNLQGRLRRIDSPDGRRSAWRIVMHYGINILYVQERTGYDIEAAIRNDADVIAEIAVTDSGRARLRDLLIDGQSTTP